jgi:hypothetical protein
VKEFCVSASPLLTGIWRYAKGVRRHHLAINAMKKLKTGWAAMRRNVLGSAKTA